MDISKKIDIMIETPDFLRDKINITYPPYNNIIFEEYFYNKYIISDIKTDRIYLPIFWTSLYVNRNFGKGDISDIQKFLNSLDRSKKYYTIVQYADNILNDLFDLDIIIFAMGGYGRYKDKCYVIPLICKQPLQIDNFDKTILASFIGVIKGRHKIREKIRDILSKNKDYIISESIGYDEFRKTMGSSIFSLCPRGYGQTSFRICESLQVGSIPVYIYDEPLIPFETEFDFSKIGILISEKDIDNIDEILSSKTEEDIQKYREFGSEIYKKYFEYDGCYESIIEVIKKNN